MDYIKIVLLLYLILRSSNILPNQNFSLHNYLRNTFLILLLILLSAHDPIVGMLVIVAILINLPNEFTEKLFTNINKGDIEELVRTLPVMIDEPPAESVFITKNPPPPPTPVEPPVVPKKDDDCVPEFIISKEMLSKAQNNIVNNDNLKKYPNELNDKNVNIQGFFHDVTGFNI